MDSWIAIYLVTLLGLIGLSGLFSGLETAAVSVNEPSLRERADQGDGLARSALRLLEDRRRILAVTLVGNNLVNVMAALLTERLLEVTLPLWSAVAIAVLNFAIITPILVIFAEIVPKHLFYLHSDRFFPLGSPLLRATAVVCVPFVNAIDAVVRTGARLFGVRPPQNDFDRRVTAEDIRALVSIDPSGGGVLTRPERLMIDRIFDLNQTMVREVMRPLVDVSAINVKGATVADVINVAKESGFSRFPAYQESMVHLDGYIDLYKTLTVARDTDSLAPFLKPAFMIPETARLDSLLRELIKRREPAAIVIDEHGTSVGWITLEDVIEEIIGEIYDEHDRKDQHKIERLSDTVWMVDARVDLDDFNRQADQHLPIDEEYDTIGGLIYTRLGRVPANNDYVLEGGLELRVMKMDGHRIRSVQITRVSEPMPAAEPSRHSREMPAPNLPRRSSSTERKAAQGETLGERSQV